MQTERIRAWDERLVQLARSIRILGPLSWPDTVEAAFFAAGGTQLPAPPPVEIDHSETIAALSTLSREIDGADPLGAFLIRTADSYRDAAEMVQHAHTPLFTERSVAIYGAPSQPIIPGAPTHLDAAEHFIAATITAPLGEPRPTMPSEVAAAWLQAKIDRYFTDEPLPVVLDDHLAALATAGSFRVRIRGGTDYTEETLRQLLQHEALVHSATKRSGRAQPLLTSLGLSSPRTTATQEGLATLAELITDTMDLARLRRIALRIQALDAGLSGADFLQVYDIFRDGGQPDTEAYRSAARIFRGGDVRGGIVFTKDVVYLKGMTTTHTFLLKAILEGHHDMPARLFAGRMTLGDAVLLEPAFDDGTLAGPQVVPDWIVSLPTLAAYLSWAGFSSRIPLGDLCMADFAKEALS
ncbi:MAG: hypothetical protein ACI8RZ_004381 [Myxococcota bacterium]|jgi:uncharacterized protein (TIGR02421 family)